MIHFLLVLSLLATGASRVWALDQSPLREELPGSRPDTQELPGSHSRPSGGLKGRFLHITDFHPDSHYKPRTSTSEDVACHRDKGDAGYFGAEGTDCDSPLTLVNATFRWIEENLKDKIDFIVWTGDSARHDNDERIPRTEEEVARLNQLLVDKFVDVFGKEDNINDTDPTNDLTIPIVPTIGNNDIMPHNILKPGPNKWTKMFLKIWDKFIPEEQRHTFVQGGWFHREVIPRKLAVVSLNTQYFYESNNAVDGCKDKSEPGYEHMEWLRVQLKLLRERNMKAILIGHVPPARSGAKQNWDETCWQKYALWLHQYRDVVVGSVYGHMNIDHFILQDSHDIDIAGFQADEVWKDTVSTSDGKFTAQSRTSYLASLRKEWSELPSPPPDDEILEESLAIDEGTEALLKKSKRKKRRRFLKKIGGRWAERYSVSLVSPSVVPNYYPTLRVIEYNVTGLEDAVTWAEAVTGHNSSVVTSPVLETNADSEEMQSSSEVDATKKKHKKKKGKGRKGGKNKKKKKPKFKVPEPPSSSAPPGPAYSNQPLSWLSYTQYFANLTRINSEAMSLQKLSEQKASNWREYKLAKAKTPDYESVRFEYEVEYDTKNDKVYKMTDLTVRSFFKLATRIADDKPKKEDQLLAGVSDDEHSMNYLEVGNSTHGLADTNEGDSVAEAMKKRKGKKKHKNRAWITFLDRAFVGFLDEDEIDDILEKSY